MTSSFANPSVYVQSWYLAGASSKLPKGKALLREMFGRHLALFRGHDGQVRVVDETPASGLFSTYPVDECHGCIYVFAGDKPAFPLPSFEFWSDEELLVSRLRPRMLSCHPHHAVASGLDIARWTAHGFEMIEEPELTTLDAHRVQARLRMRLPSGAKARVLHGLGGNAITLSFTTWGGNMATIEGWVGRLPVLVLVMHEPRADGRSLRQTLVFAPRLRRAPYWLKLEKAFLALAEIAVGGLALESDAGPAHSAFVEQVEAMPLFGAFA